MIGTTALGSVLIAEDAPAYEPTSHAIDTANRSPRLPRRSGGLVCRATVALLMTLSVSLVFNLRSSSAAILVDFSPDTTGASLGSSSFTNQYNQQIVGDRFTLASDALLSGGAVFSFNSGSTPQLGANVRFMVFEDIAGVPSSTPTLDILTTIDGKDSMFTTTQSSLARKHASISPTFLAAGTYWFSLPGQPGFGNNTLAALTSGGGYDDASSRRGTTNLPITQSGDMFFQVEGVTVPEPASLPLLGLTGLGLVASRRRRMALPRRSYRGSRLR